VEDRKVNGTREALPGNERAVYRVSSGGGLVKERGGGKKLKGIRGINEGERGKPQGSKLGGKRGGGGGPCFSPA